MPLHRKSRSSTENHRRTAAGAVEPVNRARTTRGQDAQTPNVLPGALVYKRVPTVAPRFSVHLGVQYYTFSTLANHAAEPVKITGRTRILDVPAGQDVKYTACDCDGNPHPLRSNRPPFPKRQYACSQAYCRRSLKLAAAVSNSCWPDSQTYFVKNWTFFGMGGRHPRRTRATTFGLYQSSLHVRC